MRAAAVVKPNVASERSSRLGDVGVRSQIHLFVFDGPPKPLDEDIVPPRRLTNAWLRSKSSVLRPPVESAIEGRAAPRHAFPHAQTGEGPNDGLDAILQPQMFSFDAGLRQPDDVRGPPRGRKKGVWRRRKKRSIIARPWETPNRGKFIMCWSCTIKARCIGGN